jgi:adenylyl-sulfate kinase
MMTTSTTADSEPIEEPLGVTRSAREALKRHRGVTVWLTGPRGAGKYTLARLLDRMLTDWGVHCQLLDGDAIRHGLNRDLNASEAGHEESIRRLGEVAKLFTQAGLITLVVCSTPYRAVRRQAREMQKAGDFLEVYAECPLDVCELRDSRHERPRAWNGEAPSSRSPAAPYEPPEAPELVLHTDSETPTQSSRHIIEYLDEHEYLFGV